jgi:hypothetical protein
MAEPTAADRQRARAIVAEWDETLVDATWGDLPDLIARALAEERQRWVDELGRLDTALRRRIAEIEDRLGQRADSAQARADLEARRAQEAEAQQALAEHDRDAYFQRMSDLILQLEGLGARPAC